LFFRLINDALGQATHTAEQHLGRAVDQLRPAREIWIETLDAAVVERQDVVSYRFGQPGPLQLCSFSGSSAARSCTWLQSLVVS
jgi:hypothetical protein